MPVEQDPRAARVLAEDEVGLPQLAQHAQRDVLEVADRRRADRERHGWSLQLGGERGAQSVAIDVPDGLRPEAEQERSADGRDLRVDEVRVRRELAHGSLERIAEAPAGREDAAHERHLEAALEPEYLDRSAGPASPGRLRPSRRGR